MTVNETCSYVFVSDKIKIINISHIQDPISPREAHAVRISNLKAFRNILMTIHVLQQDGFPWPNRDSFCFFFLPQKIRVRNFVVILVCTLNKYRILFDLHLFIYF